MFTRRSKAAFFAALIGLLYGIYLISYWSGTLATAEDDAEVIGAGIATALVLPHMLITWLAVIFGIIGFFTRKAGLLLTAAILYCVGALFFLLYAAFLIPSIVLGFIGYSVQKKINTSASKSE